MYPDDCLLSNIGDNTKYSLKHVVECNDSELDEEPTIIDHSPYYDQDSLVEVIKHKQDIFKCH